MDTGLIGKRVKIVEVLEPDAFHKDAFEVIGRTGRFLSARNDLYSPQDYAGEFVYDSGSRAGQSTWFHRVRVVLASEASPQALAAVKAAKNAHRWGYWAAYQYAEKRGVSALMWFHALRVECGRFTKRAIREMHHG